jgi:hypothetical protein
MNLLKKGMLFLFAATLFVACSDDDEVVTPVTPEEPVNNHPLAGTSWSLAQQAGALAVGPAPDNLTWWANNGGTDASTDPPGDIAVRACIFDDVITFEADYHYHHEMGSETWVESWQDGSDEGCRAPIAPHDGSNDATWSADASTVTIVGDGAHIGLAKVHNTGEDGNPADDTITYNYVLDGDTLTVSVTGGWHPEANATWAFVYTKN